MTVDDLITEVILREGRTYTDRPADKGGPTKFGITLQTLAAWRGRPVSAADVEALEEAEARCIYRKQFVERWQYDAIADPALQALMVDWTVTSGPDDPIKALQRLLKVPVDGAFGSRTRAALAAAADKRSLYVQLVTARTLQLLDEALDDTATVAFLQAHPEVDLHNVRGWVRRSLTFFT